LESIQAHSGRDVNPRRNKIPVGSDPFDSGRRGNLGFRDGVKKKKLRREIVSSTKEKWFFPDYKGKGGTSDSEVGSIC